jgi:endonuclease G, mitochondrial
MQGSKVGRVIIIKNKGGPLLYAIRSNFYVGTGNTEHFLRYLTDTEAGASGSPVLDDAWQVLALHHAATRVSPQKYDMAMQGMSTEEVVIYHNEGITIHSILDDLPTEVKQEIAKSQGWQ